MLYVPLMRARPALLILLLCAMALPPAGAVAGDAQTVEVASIDDAQPIEVEFVDVQSAESETKDILIDPEVVDIAKDPSEDTSTSLDLSEALERALLGNPALQALKREIYAAQARQIQGGLAPNPEVEAELSEFLGTAEMRFFRSATTGVGVSQLIERGDKAVARMSVASQEQAVAGAEIERSRLEIMYAVAAAYTKALVAQDRLRLALELENLSARVQGVVALQVEGGRAARLELKRVEIGVSTVRMEREQLERELANALDALASLWGAKATDFTEVEGTLELPANLPELDTLRELLLDNPELQRWTVEEELRRAKVCLAVAEGVPDLTVSGGVERFEETDSFGLRLGVSVPLPLHDRNQGSVMEAREYLDQVAELRQAELRTLEERLVLAYGDLNLAYTRAASLRDTVLPPAEETFDLIELGYRYGKFGVLDVLDAQRTVIEARQQFVDALADYELAAVEIERLTTHPLSESVQAKEATSQLESLSEAIEEALAIQQPANTDEDFTDFPEEHSHE